MATSVEAAPTTMRNHNKSPGPLSLGLAMSMNMTTALATAWNSQQRCRAGQDDRSDQSRQVKRRRVVEEVDQCQRHHEHAGEPGHEAETLLPAARNLKRVTNASIGLSAGTTPRARARGATIQEVVLEAAP